MAAIAPQNVQLAAVGFNQGGVANFDFRQFAQLPAAVAVTNFCRTPANAQSGYEMLYRLSKTVPAGSVDGIYNCNIDFAGQAILCYIIKNKEARNRAVQEEAQNVITNQTFTVKRLSALIAAGALAGYVATPAANINDWNVIINPLIKKFFNIPADLTEPATNWGMRLYLAYVAGYEFLPAVGRHIDCMLVYMVKIQNPGPTGTQNGAVLSGQTLVQYAIGRAGVKMDQNNVMHSTWLANQANAAVRDQAKAWVLAHATGLQIIQNRAAQSAAAIQNLLGF